MVDLEKIITNLKKLEEKSEQHLKLDDFVEDSFKKSRHTHFVESLRKRVEYVRKQIRDADKTFHPVTGITPVIYSKLHSIGKRELYLTLLGLIPIDYINVFGLDLGEFIREYDAKDHRLMLPDEFERRSEILLERAEEGVLDDLYGTAPFEILHQTIGRHGELLERLGIQPFDSKIYAGVHLWKPVYEPPFEVLECTIEYIHEALRAGKTSCAEIVIAFLTRLVGYEGNIPLQSIIKVNYPAFTRAVELDEEFSETGVLRPLHGIPVILNDNFDTHDMATTAGSTALVNSIPPDDAFQVKALRKAGAIVLAKSNIDEWAFSPVKTVSSVGGTTSNPYDCNRVPAGSSGGTAAAISASFGVIGLGTDTGNGIRGPSSHCCLVGLRPTIGLTSRDGIVPLYFRNDVGGPMCRTVEDVARVLDVIARYDPADPLTRRGEGHIPESYTQFLSTDVLDETRIGVLRHYIEDPTTDSEIIELFNKAITELETLGATLIDPFVIGDLDRLAENILCRSFRADIDTYLKSLGENAPVKTLNQIIQEKKFSESTESTIKRLSKEDNTCDEVYEDPNNIQLINTVRIAMEKAEVEAFVFPTWSNPPRRHGDYTNPAGDNSQQISPHTGMPAITVPMGFTSEGLPTGLQIISNHFQEPLLFKIAYVYEQKTKHRKPPKLFPELEFSIYNDIVKLAEQS